MAAKSTLRSLCRMVQSMASATISAVRPEATAWPMWLRAWPRPP